MTLGTHLELGFRWAGDDDHPFADVWAFRRGNLRFTSKRKMLCSPGPSPIWARGAHALARGYRASAFAPAASTLGTEHEPPLLSQGSRVLGGSGRCGLHHRTRAPEGRQSTGALLEPACTTAAPLLTLSSHGQSAAGDSGARAWGWGA